MGAALLIFAMFAGFGVLMVGIGVGEYWEAKARLLDAEREAIERR